MPTSQQHHISLRRQYRHLRRDWDNYKTSIARRRRSPSVADPPPSAADFHTRLLQISPKKFIAPQRNAQIGRALIKAFDEVEEAEAVEVESPPGPCDCCSSSPSPSARNKYVDEGSSCTDNGGDVWVEKDMLRVEKNGDEWMEKLGVFGIALVAVFVGVFSFAFLFGVEDASQLMAPT